MNRTKPIQIIECKKFEYLNLEVNNSTKRIISLDKQKHICYCYIEDKDYKHILHSESQHLNSITDLIIELGDSLYWYNEKFYKIIELINESMVSRNKKLQQIQENQEYLKICLQKIDNFDSTIKGLTKKFKALNLKNFPNKQDINSLRQLIEENKPKEIEIQSKDLVLQIKNQSETNKKHFESQIEKLEQMLKEIKFIQLN